MMSFILNPFPKPKKARILAESNLRIVTVLIYHPVKRSQQQCQPGCLCHARPMSRRDMLQVNSDEKALELRSLDLRKLNLTTLGSRLAEQLQVRQFGSRSEMKNPGSEHLRDRILKAMWFTGRKDEKRMRIRSNSTRVMPNRRVSIGDEGELKKRMRVQLTLGVWAIAERAEGNDFGFHRSMTVRKAFVGCSFGFMEG